MVSPASSSTVFSIKEFFGIVAQLGERCVRNAEVEGSNPFGSRRLQVLFAAVTATVMLLFAAQQSVVRGAFFICGPDRGAGCAGAHV